MPDDSKSKRTTIRTERDTHVAEINRLQRQRDELADLVRVSLSWLREGKYDQAETIVYRLNRILGTDQS